MRRCFAAALLGLALSSSTGCGAPALRPVAPPPSPPAPEAEDPTSWLPAYTPAQLALLTPVEALIKAPAKRVYPDLSRFWYIKNRPLESPAEAIRFNQVVNAVLNASPRLYALDEATSELENPIVQYGPPPPAESDGWTIARRSEGGFQELVKAAVSDEARASFEKGEALAQTGDPAGAAAAFRTALAKSPEVPAIRVALADALVKSGRDAEAETACNEAISIDPTFAPAHLILAEIAERRRNSLSYKPLAEALAYQPNSPRALALATRLGIQKHAPLFPIFLDVDQKGAIHVAGARTIPAQTYAQCRAVMRYEPELRAVLFEQPKETPYHLSVIEEVICLEAALGAYLADRHVHPDKAPDPRLEQLLEIAQEEGLSGYAMFEILGQYRPERARIAPPEVHRAIVRYVELHVLGQSKPPESVYTAHEMQGPDEPGDSPDNQAKPGEARSASQQRPRQGGTVSGSAWARWSVATSAALTLTASHGEGARGGPPPFVWQPAIQSPRATTPSTRQAALLAVCGAPDSALIEVATRSAHRQAEGGALVGADELAFSLRAAGDPHVWPRAWSIAGVALNEDDIARRVKSWITPWNTLGIRRCGIGRAKDASGGEVVAAVAIDALADIAPLPTTARVGQWVTLEGSMLIPATSAKVVLLGPRGAPRTVVASLSGNKIHSSFAIDQAGGWLIQVLATVATGPRPVLEAMIFAGSSPPAQFTPSSAPGEAAGKGARDDDDAMLRMINAARASEQLTPLARDADLDKLARAHSEEMLKTRVVGHDVGGGDPAARLKAAGVRAHVAGENVANASSLENAHRALWASPSHRGNLLLDQFTRVGVAVVKGPDGMVWVTEMFAG